MAGLNLTPREVLASPVEVDDMTAPGTGSPYRNGNPHDDGSPHDGGTRDVDLMIDLLGDADPGVRLRAALDLGELAAESAAAHIVARFGWEPEFQVREALTWAALRMPRASIPHVIASLHSPRWLARLQAVHTLSKLGRPQDAALLVPLVGDPVDSVAARAYGAAAHTGNPEVIPALVGALSRGRAEHRASLTLALAAFGSGAVPALVEALGAGAGPVRRHAADVLGYLGSPAADAAVAALERAVADPEEAVRLAALNALGQLRVPEAWWAVDAAGLSTEPRLRHLAARLNERRPRGRRFDPLVTCEGGAAADELIPVLAAQVRVGRPQYLSRQDVPEEVLAAVRREAEALARAQGRTEAMVARMAAGRVEQHLHETVLLEQVSVVNPGMRVTDLLLGRGVRITGFATLTPGG